MSNIAIFAKRAFLNTNPSQEFISKEKSYKGYGHLQRVSSIIRADQIADYLGAKFNPTEGYQDDVTVYVKPYVKKGNDFVFEGKRAYLDIVDGHNLGQLALKYPEVGVIVCSQADYETMSNALPNKIVLIPQHHANFERQKKKRTAIKVVGIIGEKNAFDYIPRKIREELKKRDIELLEYSKFFSRQDIIDFYMNIDVQLVWRPYRKILSNPLKIVNASSFGVPTIALDEPAFKEMEGTYIGVTTPEEWLSRFDYLCDNDDVYDAVSQYCREKAENYHISSVAKLYQQL